MSIMDVCREDQSAVHGRLETASPDSKGELAGAEQLPIAAIIAWVREFVIANVALPLAPSDLAAATGLDLAMLRGILIEQAGCSPAGFILQVRLELARSRLCTNTETRSQAQIAAALGFSSGSVFSRAYARRYGETMSVTRRRAVLCADGRAEQVKCSPSA